jgi:hypothetical protein
MALTGKAYGRQPALPSSRVEEQVSAKVAYHEGVTRRDLFAAFALMGLLANPRDEAASLSPEQRATAAAGHADLLCEQLAKDGAA